MRDTMGAVKRQVWRLFDVRHGWLGLCVANVEIHTPEKQLLPSLVASLRAAQICVILEAKSPPSIAR